MENALYAALGWMFGLLSALVLEWNRRARTVAALRKAVAFECAEIAYRLANVVYGLSIRLGKADPELLNWLSEAYGRYHGRHRNPTVIETMAKLAANPEQACKDMETLRRNSPDKKPILQKYPAPALEAARLALSDLSKDDLLEVLEMLTLLSIFDRLVDDSREHFKMTFDQEASESNRIAIETNLNQTYAQALSVARQIVDLAHSYIARVG